MVGSWTSNTRCSEGLVAVVVSTQVIMYSTKTVQSGIKYENNTSRLIGEMIALRN